MKKFFASLLPLVFGGIVALASEQSLAAALLILTALIFVWARGLAEALDRIEAKLDGR